MASASSLLDAEGYYVAPNALNSTKYVMSVGRLKVKTANKLIGTKAISVGFVDKTYFDGVDKHFEFSLNVSFFFVALLSHFIHLF
jgi:hypothetical protein